MNTVPYTFLITYVLDEVKIHLGQEVEGRGGGWVDIEEAEVR